MAVSYKKLWHILVDRDMKKRDLERKAGITHYQIYKLTKNMDVSTEVLRAKVIILRYGLLDGKTRTLEEVGSEISVTRERVRQIESKALRKLRNAKGGKLSKFIEY